MPSGRRAGRFLVAAGIAAGALLMTGAHASAHTELVDSSPQDGSAVATSPQRIELHFTRQVSVALVLVSVNDVEGRDVAVTSRGVDPNDPTVLLVGVPHLRDDTYLLRYNLLDQVDLHRTVGSIVFGVGGRAVLAPQGSTTIGPGALESILQYGTVSGFSVLLGAGFFLLTVVPRVRETLPDVGHVRRRVLRIALVGAGVVAAAAVGHVLSRASSLPEQTGLGGLLTGTDFGRWWLVSTAAALLAGVMVTLELSMPPRRWSDVVTALTAGLAACGVVAVAAVGHNGDATAGSFAGTAMRSVHLLAVGVWAGGLGILLAVLSGLRGPSLVATRRAVIRAFSPLAAVSFLGIVASGLVLAGVQVQTVTSLLSTAYGAELIVKVGIVLAVAALALWHTLAIRRPRPGHSPRRVRRGTLALELAGAASIIAIAVVLGGTAPARGPAFDAPPPLSASAASVTPGDLLVHLSLRPNLPGTNVLELRAVSSRRPAPGPVTSITVDFSGPAAAPSTLDLAVDASGSASRTLTLQSSGAMFMDVTVQRAGLPQIAARIDWTVGTPQVPRHPTVVSTMPVAPFAFGGAAAVFVAGLLAGAVAVRRHRRFSAMARRDAGPTVAAPIRPDQEQPVAAG